MDLYKFDPYTRYLVCGICRQSSFILWRHMMTLWWRHRDIDKGYNLRQVYSYTNLKNFICTKGIYVQDAFVNWVNFKDFMAVLVQFYGLFYTKNGISQTFFLQSYNPCVLLWRHVFSGCKCIKINYLMNTRENYRFFVDSYVCRKCK